MDRKLLYPNERHYMYHASTSALQSAIYCHSEKVSPLWECSRERESGRELRCRHFHFKEIMELSICRKQTGILKGLSHEIYLKKFDKQL
jgi:hypothetical protein